MVSPTSATDESGKNSKVADSSAIINGTAGSISTYPWMAYLGLDTGEQFCGASLISPTWILAAAH